jgi:tetratricopeptide (TPR) repeat protein
VSTSDPNPEVERETAELAALQRVLKVSRGTFSLSFAVCNSVPLRNHLIEKAKASCSGIEVLSVPEGMVDVYGWALSQPTGSEPAALFIVDIDRSIRSDEKSFPILASLNASKDLWPKRFHCPVIFWLPEYAATLISIHARDFWARKSHQFHFAAEPLVSVATAQSPIQGDADWAINLDADRKQFRIAELQQRISEIGDNPSTEIMPHLALWLNELGLLLQFTGKASDALEVHERAAVLVQNLGDKESTTITLNNIGMAYEDQGEYLRALQSYEKALALARETGDRQREGHALGNLGNIRTYLGDIRRAIECYEKALPIAQETGDRRSEGAYLLNTGNAYIALGEARRGIDCALKGLGIAHELGNRTDEAGALGTLGNGYLKVGEVRRAIKFYESALAIFRELGNPIGQANSLWNLALAQADLDQWQDATRLGEEALAIREATQDPRADEVRRVLARWRKGEAPPTQTTSEHPPK